MIKTDPPTPNPIQFKDGPPPEAPEPYTVYMPQYHRQQRDQALGIYMDAWSRAEGALLSIMSDMISPEPHIGRAIFAVLSAAQIRDVMTALSRTAYEGDGQKKLEKLLERVKRAATKRNRIVHGRWKLEIDMNHDTGIVFNAEWARLYEPSDPEQLALVEDSVNGGKVRDCNCFTVAHLLRGSQEVDRLLEDLLNFRTATPKKSPAQPPKQDEPLASPEAK